MVKSILIKGLFLFLIVSFLWFPYYHRLDSIDIKHINDGKENVLILMWNQYINWYGQPVIADVNNDGMNDIIVGYYDAEASKGGIYVFNGESGSVIWKKRLDSLYRVPSLYPLITDVDRDGFPDVIISDDIDFYIFRGRDGSLISKFSNYTLINGDVKTVEDFDGDGKLEVISGGPKFRVFRISDGSYLWNFTVKEYQSIDNTWGYHYYPSIGDLDNDGKIEVVIVGDYGVIALNGEDGSVLWNYSMDLHVIKPWGYYSVIGDVDGDNRLEVIVTGYGDYAIFALNGEDGSLLWNYTFNYYLGSYFSLGDLDGNGYLEVVVIWYKSVFVLNGKDGSLLWNQTIEANFNDSLGYYSVIGDVDGDNRLEVIVTGDGGQTIIALNGENGSISWNYTLAMADHSLNHFILGDVDGDTHIEAIFVSNGNIYVFDIPKAGFRIFWNAFKGDFLNRGSSSFIDSDGDGLSNYSEQILGTNLNIKDSDGDGYNDGIEVYKGLNPLNFFDGWQFKALLISITSTVVIFLLIFVIFRKSRNRKRDSKSYS